MFFSRQRNTFAVNERRRTTMAKILKARKRRPVAKTPEKANPAPETQTPNPGRDDRF